MTFYLSLLDVDYNIFFLNIIMLKEITLTLLYFYIKMN